MEVKGSKKRIDRLIREKRKNFYMKTNTAKATMVCSNCGAIYLNGKWIWKDQHNSLRETTCPACKRINDNYPAGFVEIRGRFYREHEKEISNLIVNMEKTEKKERPLERIMMFRPEKSRATLTTTGIHIAKRIGEALSKSYQGNFTFRYLDGEKSIRVLWERQ
jgi:NMD protein affecting ribosome stability and mRNA decay